MEKIKRYLKNKDRLYAIGFILFSVWLYSESCKFRKSIFDTLGSGTFPKILAIVIGFCSFLQLFTAKDKEENGETQKSDYAGVLFVIAEFFIYAFLFDRLGFILDSVLFLMAFVLFFDKRPIKEKIKGALLFSVVFSLIMYVLFGVMLNVLLPTLFL